MPDYPSSSTGCGTSFVVINDDDISSTNFSRSKENSTTEKRSSGSIYCRICHDDSSNEELIDPCECSGTLALIHSSCLEKWLSTSNTECCEICKHEFYVQRKNKSIFESLWQWWKSRSSTGFRGIAGDALCLIVLTPLCIAATYLCGIGATAYVRLGFWEGSGLALMCIMLVATYCLWLVVTLRFYCKSWQEWRTRNPDIKLLVKHRSDEIGTNPTTKPAQHRDYDENTIMLSATSPRLNRLDSWLGMYFNYSNDPFVAVQQTSYV